MQPTTSTDSQTVLGSKLEKDVIGVLKGIVARVCKGHLDVSRNRGHPGEDEIAKKRKRQEDPEEEYFPMNTISTVINGVRHLAPYWTVFRCGTKGRWIGRQLVEVFSSEFLSTHKHYAYVACKMGRIYVNGKQMTDPTYVFKNGDHVHHYGHRHEHPVLDRDIRVIADTDHLLVVDKPPSLPVHACGQYAVHTVLGQLRTRYGITGLRVLHRLDRTTSGVLLFAKNYETDLEFKSTLKSGDWAKEYVLKVRGVFPEGEVFCDAPIAPLSLSMGIQCVREDGKDARTRFTRLWTDGENSVLRALIDTGRTHQIRVHAQYLGFPILGDQIYDKDVWGPHQGKDGKYGKSFEQLVQDVQTGHRSSNWHETVDPAYEDRLSAWAEGREPIPLEKEGLTLEERPDTDPLCLSCNVVKKKVPEGHFTLPLHCLKYNTEKWCFKTDLPEWAVEPSADVIEQKKQGLNPLAL